MFYMCKTQHGARMALMSSIISIYTDGGCHGNPGPGAWAALLFFEGHEKEISGFESDTTNNRMELTAALEAFKVLKKPNISNKTIQVHTDSKYLCEGMQKWLPGWKARQWKTANNDPVKNQDLWEALDHITTGMTIEWFWVKGHSGHPQNERVDALVQATLLQEKQRHIAQTL